MTVKELLKFCKVESICDPGDFINEYVPGMLYHITIEPKHAITNYEAVKLVNHYAKKNTAELMVCRAQAKKTRRKAISGKAIYIYKAIPFKLDTTGKELDIFVFKKIDRDVMVRVINNYKLAK